MTKRLTLRARLALLTATAVALAVAACAITSWFLVRGQLYAELDRRLKSAAGPPSPPGEAPPRFWRFTQQLTSDLQNCQPTATNQGSKPPPPGPYQILQLVTADGRPCAVPYAGSLAVTDADVEVAKGQRRDSLHDCTGIDKYGEQVSVRVYTVQFEADDGTRAAVSYALPLDEVEGPLSTLAWLLIAVSALGVLVSAAAGLVIARASLRPVDELTDVVEHIARTEDLDTTIPAEGVDEIARLSRSFNTMTAALAASRERQQQLIADAGHELRTPLTSLRTNIDLLMRSEDTGRPLPPETRHRMLVSVKAQMQELSSLVGDLLELARPEQEEPVQEEVGLHEVVERAVERARLRGPGLHIQAETKPWYVHGDSGSLERAVVNLLDNAVKFSPPDGTVEVRLADGELTVRDHGPGIDPEDLPHVFERFWRSTSARSLPGSGLGLSIVSRIVHESGGEVRLDPADGGGTLARVRLPGAVAPTA
ncbi:HAMP domain-containing sensor histidine kinase [Actinomadura rudentiformis]|uniref:histidine kinase n=1 Tax=Actinomadura rudentiformis TaxID=359158 RepID=A0A6H9YRA8_9ACTN|nr:HAMP domain-containing sensor histidine kinase [Actinomadura rudentiformis]KAB2349088.1 HAMP domain-containing histidine kinase [Actinomadura rudentiformis]